MYGMQEYVQYSAILNVFTLRLCCSSECNLHPSISIVQPCQLILNYVHVLNWTKGNLKKAGCKEKVQVALTWIEIYNYAQ